jgi:hypothetical protein
MPTSLSLVFAPKTCLFTREFLAICDHPEAIEDGLYFTREFLQKPMGKDPENNPVYTYWLLGTDVDEQLGQGEEAGVQLAGWRKIQELVNALFTSDRVLEELSGASFVLSVNESINDPETSGPMDSEARDEDLTARSFNRVAEFFFSMAYRVIEQAVDATESTEDGES